MYIYLYTYNILCIELMQMHDVVCKYVHAKATQEQPNNGEIIIIFFFLLSFNCFISPFFFFFLFSYRYYIIRFCTSLDSAAYTYICGVDPTTTRFSFRPITKVIVRRAIYNNELVRFYSGRGGFSKTPRRNKQIVAAECNPSVIAALAGTPAGGRDTYLECI